MGRPMTVSKPVDLTAMIDGPRTRLELGTTNYAVRTAEKAGNIKRDGKEGQYTLWALTPKGRRKAKKLAAA